MLKRTLIPVFLLAIARVPAHADAVDLSLIPPSGVIEGSPGSVIGWGYSITNNTADWLLATNLDAGLFPLDVTPLNIFDFPEIAPGATVSESFSTAVTAACPGPPCGLYELTLGAVTPGDSFSGAFDISVDRYDNDPFNGGNFLGSAPDLTADFNVIYTATPEPGTLLSVATVLGLLGARKLRLSLRR